MKREHNNICKVSQKIGNPGNKRLLKINANILESHYRRLEQEEDRISGLEDKIHIKEKIDEYTEKRLKSYECARILQCQQKTKRMNPRH
jgi:hypothetical protein